MGDRYRCAGPFLAKTALGRGNVLSQPANSDHYSCHPMLDGQGRFRPESIIDLMLHLARGTTPREWSRARRDEPVNSRQRALLLEVGAPREARRHLLDLRGHACVVRIRTQETQRFMQTLHLTSTAQARALSRIRNSASLRSAFAPS